MTVKSQKVIDPAEEWLMCEWLGDSYSSMTHQEARKETKKKIFDYLYNLLEASNHTTPPINPGVLFEQRKVLRLDNCKLPARSEAMLIPTVGGFIVKIDREKRRSRYRERFSIAHELGHTFFFDLTSEKPTFKFQNKKARLAVQEGYSNEIAAAILVPEQILTTYVSKGKLQPSLSNLQRLSNIFHVSYDVLRQRLILLDIWDCIIFESKKITPNAEIRTKSVSKGSSYKARKWTIPRVLAHSSEGKKMERTLYPVLKSMHEDKATEQEVNLNGSTLIVESMRLNRPESHLILIRTPNAAASKL